MNKTIKIKKCCGNCGNGETHWKRYGNSSSSVKRIRCGVDVPEVDFPPTPIWAWYELMNGGNDDLMPSDGKDCPCWR